MLTTLHDAESPVIPVLLSFKQQKSKLCKESMCMPQETEMDSESAVLVSMETTGMRLFGQAETTEGKSYTDNNIEPPAMSPQPETLKERTTDRNAIEALTCNSPTLSSPLWTYDIVPPVIPNDDDELDSEAPVAKGENIKAPTARFERIDDEDVEKSAPTTECGTKDQTLYEDTSEPNITRLNIEHEKRTDLNINLNTNIERIGDSDNEFDSDITTLETQGIKPRSTNLGIHVFGRPNSCKERDLNIKTMETQKNKVKMNNHLFNKMRSTENDTEFDSDETRLETQKEALRDHQINRNIKPFHHNEDSDATTLDTQFLHRVKAFDNTALKHQGISADLEDNTGIGNNEIDNDGISIDNNISTQNSTVSSNMKITPSSFDFKFTQDSAVSSNHGNRKQSISSTGLDFSDNDSDETRFDASQVIVKLGGNPLNPQSPSPPQTCTNMSESLISQKKMAALKQRFSDRPNEIERKDGQLFQTGYQPKELKDTAGQHRSKESPMAPDVELTQSSGTTSRSRGSSDRSKKSQGQRSSNSKSRLEDMEKMIKERHVKGIGILNKLETRLSKLQATLNTGTFKVEELKSQLTSIHLTIKHIGAANKKEREDIKGDTDTRPTLKRLQLKLMTERHGKLATVVKQFQKLTSQLKNKSIAKPVEGIPSTKTVIHQDADVIAKNNQTESSSKTRKMQSIAKGKTFIAPFKDTGKDTQNVNSSIQTPNAQSTVTTAQFDNMIAQSSNLVAQSNKQVSMKVQPITTLAQSNNTNALSLTTTAQPDASAHRSVQSLDASSQSNVVTVHPIKQTVLTQSSVTVSLPTGPRIFDVIANNPELYELNCLTPNKITKTNLVRTPLETISQTQSSTTKPPGTTNLAQSSTAKPSLVQSSIIHPPGTTNLAQSSTTKPPGPTSQTQSSAIKPSFGSPEIVTQKNNPNHMTNVKTIFGSPDSLASSYHDTAQGTQGSVAKVFKAAKKQCVMSSRAATLNERVQPITTKTSAVTTTQHPIAPSIQSINKVSTHIPTPNTIISNQFKIPHISKPNLPPATPVTMTTQNDIIITEEPGIPPFSKVGQRIDGSKRSNSNSKLYPDLQELLKYEVISKGQNVLSLEVKGNMFYASLEDSGIIRGAGGEMFKTPMQWCTALMSTSASVGCIKRQQAYQRVCYKGRPLSSFRVPDIGISEPDQHKSVYEQSRPGYEQSRPGYEQSRPGYEQSRSGNEQSKPGYEQSKTGYEQSRPGNEQSNPGQSEGQQPLSLTTQKQCITPFGTSNVSLSTQRTGQLQSVLSEPVEEAHCLTWCKVRLISNAELNPSNQWLPNNFWSTGFKDVEFSEDFISKCIETIDIW